MMIKLRRIQVLQQAYKEREDEVRVKTRTMGKQEARERARGMFALTRERGRRFMVTVGETSGPTPMDWIFDARSYGMKIRYNTPGANRID